MHPGRSLVLVTLGMGLLSGPNASFAQHHPPLRPFLPTLTKAYAAHNLTPEQAAQNYPVHLWGVVTYYDPNVGPQPVFIFADSSGGIDVQLQAAPPVPLQVGDFVEVAGVSGRGAFAPILNAASLRVLGKSHVPFDAPKVSLSPLLTGTWDRRWVEVEGVVHAVLQSGNYVHLQLALSDGVITATTPAQTGGDYDSLVDAKVRLRGNAVPRFNSQHQLIGAALLFPNRTQLVVEEAAPTKPFDARLSSVADLLRFVPGAPLQRRVHLRGTVTLAWPGDRLCIEDGADSLCAQSDQVSSLHPGDVVDVVGFPTPGEFTPTLTNAIYKPTGVQQPANTAAVSAEQLLHSDKGYDAHLVELQGQLLGQNESDGNTTIVLASGRNVFSALLPASVAELPQWEKGTTLKLTGISAVKGSGDKNDVIEQGFSRPESFRILLRSPQDAVVLKLPSWWTPAHLLTLFGGISVLSLGILAWVIVLRKRVQSQSQSISEKNEESSQLRAANEEANRERSDLLAGLSDEMRAPANGMLGIAGLALRSSPAEQQREYLEMVQGAAGDLLTLSDDVLDYARILAEKVSLESRPFHLSDVVGEALHTVAPVAYKKGLELTLSVGAGVPSEIVGDPQRMRQVLLNLVRNAIRFTSKGEVAVAVNLEPTDNQEPLLHFAVRDTGLGIFPPLQADLFAAPQQGDSSAPRGQQTGLGQALCKRMVTLLGGEMWIESAPGAGAVFHFTMKFSRVNKTVDPPAQPGERLRGLSVLLIDDNDSSRSILRKLTERWQMQPQEAVSGAEGLRKLQDSLSSGRPYRLVLLDQQMPDMDAFEFLRSLPPESRWKNAIIMMLTAVDESATRAKCLEMGVNACLLKPVKPSELLASVQKILAMPDTQPILQEPSRGANPAVVMIAGRPKDGIDKAELLGQADGDAQFLRELIDMFQTDSRALMQQVADAVSQQNPAELERAANKLAGTVSIFGGHKAMQAALQLEAMGRERNLSRAGEVLLRLKEQVEALEETLNELRQEAWSGGSSH